MRTAQEIMISMPRFYLPEDLSLMCSYWITPEQAAAKWGVSRSTIFRWMRKHPEIKGEVAIYRADPWPKICTMIRSEAKRPDDPRGNPKFRESRWQSQIAREREKVRRLRTVTSTGSARAVTLPTPK